MTTHTLPRKNLDKLISVAQRRLSQRMTPERRAAYADVLWAEVDGQAATTQARADRLRELDRLAQRHWDLAMAPQVRVQLGDDWILDWVEYVDLPMDVADAYPATLIDEHGEPIRAEAA